MGNNATSIAQRLRRGEAFAAFALPGESVCRVADGESTIFEMHPWDKSLPVVNPADCGSLDAALPFPDELSREDYLDRVATIIADIRSHSDDRKVVFARAEHRRDSGLTIERLASGAERMFASGSQTFRYICFHPSCGVWMGSTPELLLRHDRATDRFSTMALAGTLPAEEFTCWDAKNLREHAFVVDHIAARLQSLGLTPDVGATTTMHLPSILHLCTPIEGSANGVDPREIIRCLHPTPAVAGHPVDYALRLIERMEPSSRQYYAGYLMVSTPDMTAAYVNLRCLRFRPELTCHFAGGGIVVDSHPATEWRETALKLSASHHLLL